MSNYFRFECNYLQSNNPPPQFTGPAAPLFNQITPPHSLPVLQPPYLYSMHNSPVKAIQVYSDVSKEVVQTISQVGRVQLETIYSAQCKMWPIDGGVVDPARNDNRELLISGYVLM